MPITLEDLYMRNYVLVLDRTGSMQDPVKRGSSQSRWNAARESVVALARKCEEFDSDGIEVYTFNQKYQYFPNVTGDKVDEIFKTVAPMGGTDFVPVLTEVFKKHFAGDKPTTVIVVTDGEPSEASGKKAVAKLLIDTANKLEADSDLGVTFIQIGDNSEARDFLKKLDDDLQAAGAKFDIVDTKTCDDLESMSIEDVLLAAVND